MNETGLFYESEIIDNNYEIEYNKINKRYELLKEAYFDLLFKFNELIEKQKNIEQNDKQKTDEQQINKKCKTSKTTFYNLLK